MARVSKEEKQASHARIVEEAARLFREQGIEATSVAQVMSAAGLTHGGFYRHFASKEDLVCTAIVKAFENISKKLESAIAQKGTDKAIKDYIDSYLSEQHVASRGGGCPIAALGIEAGRGPDDIKTAFEAGLERLVDLLLQGMSGKRENARTKALSLLTMLVGTMVMARTIPSKAKTRKILTAARKAARDHIAA